MAYIRTICANVCVLDCIWRSLVEIRYMINSFLALYILFKKRNVFPTIQLTLNQRWLKESLGVEHVTV